VHLYYLWLPSVELAISRVKERISRGGHGIPGKIVRRRFERSIRNFLQNYRDLAEEWILFDNSEAKLRTIAKMERAAFVFRARSYIIRLLRLTEKKQGDHEKNSDERDGIAVERTCGVGHAGGYKESN